jgi:predicted  nucleic acid-binding Zn-ribbon protein
LFNNSEKNKQIEELSTTIDTKSTEIVSKTKELEDLSSEFERVKADRERLGLNNDSLNAQITDLNAYIAKIKQSGKISAQEKKKLEQLVVQLRADLVKKDQEILTLRQQNDSLKTNVSSLSEEKAKLGDSLYNVSTTKSDLESKLAYASILKATNFKITAITPQGKEIEKEEYRANKIATIKVTFSIADNKAAKKGTKTFYLRLFLPSGKVFSDPLNGGGTINDADGNEISYSLKQDAPFNNVGENYSFTLLKGFDYVPGEYKLDIYSEGYKIGDSKFVVKKASLF